MNQCKYCKVPIKEEAIVCSNCAAEVEKIIEKDEAVDALNTKFTIWNFSLFVSVILTIVAFSFTYLALNNDLSDTIGIISLFSLIIFLVSSIICAIAKKVFKNKIIKKVDELMRARHP